MVVVLQYPNLDDVEEDNFVELGWIAYVAFALSIVGLVLAIAGSVLPKSDFTIYIRHCVK